MLLPDAKPEEIERAVFELEAARLLELRRHLAGWHVRLGETFYRQIDHQVMDWRTVNDAAEVARLVLSDPQMVQVARIHDQLGWPLRRLNPAVSILSEVVLSSKELGMPDSTPQFLRRPEDLAALVRFIRAVDAAP